MTKVNLDGNTLRVEDKDVAFMTQLGQQKHLVFSYKNGDHGIMEFHLESGEVKKFAFTGEAFKRLCDAIADHKSSYLDSV